MNKQPMELSDAQIRKMHNVQLTMLIEFDRICRKHNIKYILDGGSLLGAIRHKGFIPWDDDIDIRMLRGEYEKFCEVSNELSQDMTFQNYELDKGYPWMYAKIRMNGTKAVKIGQDKLDMHSGIFIDIFPCDGVPDNNKKRKIYNIKAKICRKILYARTAKELSNNVWKCLGWNVVCLIPKKMVYHVYENMQRKYTEFNCSKVGIIGWHGIEETTGFDLKYFKDLVEVEFENHLFWAPRDWNGFLSFAFGADYMKVPPVEKQVKEHGIIEFDLGKYE